MAPQAPPATALRRLAGGSRLLRPLGGNANMHWLVSPAGGSPASANSAVLRRYGPWHSLEDVAYELRVLDRMAALGWPVPQALASPQRVGRHIWGLFRYLPGRRGGPAPPPRCGPSCAPAGACSRRCTQTWPP